ncbi:hypothetical protein FLA_1114 [Filimonas lacunae]|nr:hypothetical protein FLA_1114 [Filimonas lacunae]
MKRLFTKKIDNPPLYTVVLETLTHKNLKQKSISGTMENKKGHP